jgi:D-serine deaminase-like pyridoxal phosphate-dependent protein
VVAGGPERWAVPGLATPALVVDLETCERNIATMAAHAAAQGIALRPHAKTHKCPAVAARQRAAGASGLAVATVGEAEVFADHGADDLFVAYPLWAADDVGERVGALARRVRLAVGADSAEAVAALGRSVPSGTPLTVVVEVDCGLQRSGVAPDGAAVVSGAVADAGFVLGGVFTFPGHSYRPGATPGAVADEARVLEEAARAVEAAGMPCPVRSGGSTPTAMATTGGLVTELRPGVYVFNDAQQVTLGTCGVADVALAALATVVSAPVPERIVLDAGSKVLGPDRPVWMAGHGLLPDHPGAVVTGLWEHHAVVDVSAVAPAGRPRLGDRLAVVPNHVCTAVNLAPTLHAVAGGRVVERWDVAARGANR